MPWKDKDKKRKYFREYSKRRREECKKNGICAKCFIRKAKPNQTRCIKCSSYDKKKWVEYKKRNLCVYCYKKKCKADKDSNYCYKCREKNKQKRLNKKDRIINHYGGKCFCCGEANITFLTIDHINNDGNRHRRINQQAKNNFYNWIIQNNFPSGFQVLCWNCNMGKYINKGICPHEI
jgi:hypothetical protein